MKLLAGILLIVSSISLSSASPVSQPVYPSGQYVSAQSIPIQYSQEQQIPQGAYAQQPQYYVGVPVASGYNQQEPTRPVFENADRAAAANAPAGLVQQQQQQQLRYSTQIKQPIQQVLVATNVDRQIQRAAQLGGGPLYLQQVQAAQQQGQAQEAIRVAQNRATSQTLNRHLRPIPQQAQPQPQPQYLQELTSQLRYVRPVPVQYRPQQSLGPQQQQQQRQLQSQNPEAEAEDYDPNPSYQFGFDVNDDVYTNYQNRKEQREGNKITGSYSVVDSDGFVRTVKYTADPKEGFKAEVTRQPTDIVVKIPKPDPQYQRQQPQQYVQEVPAEQKAHQVQSQQRPNIIYQYQ